MVYLELPPPGGSVPRPLVLRQPGDVGRLWYIAISRTVPREPDRSARRPASEVRRARRRKRVRRSDRSPSSATGVHSDAIRHARYALLSARPWRHLLLRRAYENARIDRYYLGPVLMAWTWRRSSRGRSHAGGRPGAGSTRASRSSRSPWRSRSIPTLLVVPERFAALTGAATRPPRRWIDRALDVMEPDGRDRQLVELLDPLWYAQAVEGRRPDIDIIDDRTVSTAQPWGQSTT